MKHDRRPIESGAYEATDRTQPEVQVVVAMDLMAGLLMKKLPKIKQTRIEVYATVDEAKERMDEWVKAGYDTVWMSPRRLGEHVEPEPPLPEGFFDALIGRTYKEVADELRNVL